MSCCTDPDCKLNKHITKIKHVNKETLKSYETLTKFFDKSTLKQKEAQCGGKRVEYFRGLIL